DLHAAYRCGQDRVDRRLRHRPRLDARSDAVRATASRCDDARDRSQWAVDFYGSAGATWPQTGLANRAGGCAGGGSGGEADAGLTQKGLKTQGSGLKVAGQKYVHQISHPFAPSALALGRTAVWSGSVGADNRAVV